MVPTLHIARATLDSGAPEYQITYSLPRPGHVRIEITNGHGHPVCLLVNEPKEPGRHEIAWKMTDGDGDCMGTSRLHCRIIVFSPGGHVTMKSHHIAE